MNVKTRKSLRITGLLLLCILIVTVVYAFFANEARKEIYYLCGNFGTASTIDDVKRQLDTSTFSSYIIDEQNNVTQIKHSSMLLLNFKSCTVSFENKGGFVSVTYQ